MSKIFVRFETADMKKALDVCGTLTKAKTALPILQDVIIRYDRTRKLFQLIASNSEQFLALDCTRTPTGDDETERQPWLLLLEDDKKDPFREVAISLQSLREAINTLPSMPCTAWIDTAAHTLKVDYQTGQFSLPVETSTDGFPDFPTVTTPDGDPARQKASPAVVRMTTDDAQWLLQTMMQANTCSSSDDLRPVINTVCLDLFQDKLRVVATDGMCLFRLQKDTGLGYLDYGKFAAHQSAMVLVPKQSLAILQKAFAGARTLTLTADSQRVEFRAEGVAVTSVLIEGRYPNYESVVPSHNSHLLIVGRHELSAALRRIRVFANDALDMVELKRDGQYLVLSSSDDVFVRSAAERVALANADTTTLPDGFRIACNISTLLSLLAILSTGDVRLSFSNAEKAFLLKPDDEKTNLLLLQMPMMAD